jgi:hypothetical protein
MRLTRKEAVIGLVTFAAAACTVSSREPGLRLKFDPTKRGAVLTRGRSGPGLSSMGCYFASVYDGSAAEGTPSCARLGKPSELTSFDGLKSGELKLKVPLGRRKIRVWGVGSASACGGKTTVAELFESGARPSLYALGETEIDVPATAEATITSSYVAAQAEDLGACDTATVNGQVEPAKGLHRGGVPLVIGGSGFRTGATVTVGGTACAVTSLSDTEIHCTTGNIPVQPTASVVVTNPSEAPMTLSETFSSQTLVLATRNGTTGTLASAWLDPSDGSLTLVEEDDGSLVGETVGWISVHPSGLWAVVSHTGNPLEKLTLWDIDPETGRVSLRGNLSLASTPAERTAFSPSGNFLLTAYSGLMHVLTFDTGTGALTHSQAGGATANLRALLLSPSGSFVFASPQAQAHTNSYPFDDSTGILGAVITGTSNSLDSDVLVHAPAGPRFFAVGATTARVVDYEPDGQILPQNVTTTALTKTAGDLVYDAGSSSLFVLDAVSNPSVRRIVAPTASNGGGRPDTVLETFVTWTGDQTRFALDPAGSYFLAIDTSGTTRTIEVYPRSPQTGLPSASPSSSVLLAGVGAHSLAID